jgi:hypothetical protein
MAGGMAQVLRAPASVRGPELKPKDHITSPPKKVTFCKMEYCSMLKRNDVLGWKCGSIA